MNVHFSVAISLMEESIWMIIWEIQTLLHKLMKSLNKIKTLKLGKIMGLRLVFSSEWSLPIKNSIHTHIRWDTTITCMTKKLWVLINFIIIGPSEVLIKLIIITRLPTKFIENLWISKILGHARFRQIFPLTVIGDP